MSETEPRGAPRPTRELAADVRDGLLEHSGIPDAHERCGECGMVLPSHSERCHGGAAFDALDALVARVTDLEARTHGDVLEGRGNQSAPTPGDKP